MSIYEIPIASLEGQADLLGPLAGNVSLVVNVASKCGLTPQYEALESLHEKYADRGFTVVGVPCNQFMGQEPGSAEEIREFCSTTYGITFPMSEKVDVNGEGRHPLYEVLTRTATSEGVDGDITWNFEKFLVDRDGAVIARFAPRTTPDAEDVVGAIEAALA